MTLTLLLIAAALGPDEHTAPAGPRVTLETSHGTIVVELYPEQAPRTVESFLSYVDSGFYDGTVFHRVIPDFMIQGGGYSADLAKKATRPPIQNEADNALTNDRGTLAMARTPDPHSAAAQFFINTKDNGFLNHTAKTPQGWGYAVFGRVVVGMEVVDAISAVPTGNRGGFQNVPREPVVIKEASRVP